MNTYEFKGYKITSNLTEAEFYLSVDGETLLLLDKTQIAARFQIYEGDFCIECPYRARIKDKEIVIG